MRYSDNVMKVFIIYASDGYNGQQVDKVFTSWRKAADYIIETKFKGNIWYEGRGAEFLDDAAKEFISEYTVE